MRHANRSKTEYNRVMSKKKNNYSPEFKARVVMELLSGQKTLNELADQYQIAPATLSNWHKQFQERAAEVFQKGPSNKERELRERDQEIAVLQQKVGQLLIERDWLKKKSDEIFGSDGPPQMRRPRK
jgi:putative transposase